jgi:hypothetical protein
MKLSPWKKQEESKQEKEELTNSEKDILKIFSQLTNVLKETSKAHVNLPPKCTDSDDQWEGWNKQWQAYLQAKKWLSTAEYPEGPGATGLNLKINAKIYNCLVSLCQKGKTSTYVEQAADFDGHGFNKQLNFLRYDWFSKQKLLSLKKCVETIRHISGTNISNHIDKFEEICGLIVNRGFVPDEEQKIDWLLRVGRGLGLGLGLG